MLRFSPRANRASLVRWREWGEAAFEEARSAEKPLLLCITAFWCGFCQRLDETTLSSEEVITLLNGLFVPVRVEESQRPDVDARYNVHGAWPALVFLTHEGEPFLSLNYTPPEDFVRLLVRIAHAYQADRAALLEGRAEPASGSEDRTEAPGPLGPHIVEEVAGMLEGLADTQHGGFGDAPKFLHTDALEFLLDRFQAAGEREALDHVLLTLDKLGTSALFDWKEGGFYRYASRRDWREPHPEKLLDDQAAVLRVCLRAFLLTEESRPREMAEGLIDYLQRVLARPDEPVFNGCQDYVLLSRAAGEGARGPLQRLSVIDDLVYCDANARAVSACLDAWWVLGRDDLRAQALAALDWLLTRLRTPQGGAFHYWDGSAHAPGLLQDAVRLGLACLDAFACSADPAWLEQARSLARYLKDYHRERDGALRDIARPGPGLLGRPLRLLAHNAIAAEFLLRLAALAGDRSYREQARGVLVVFPNQHRLHGAYAAGFGRAVAALFGRPRLIELSGRPGESLRRQAREALTSAGSPAAVLRFQT